MEKDKSVLNKSEAESLLRQGQKQKPGARDIM